MRIIFSATMIAATLILLTGCESFLPASDANKSQFTVYSSIDNDPEIYPDNDTLETFNNYPIDKRLDTEWTTWAAQKPGDWLMIDMGKKYRLSQITLNDKATVNDFPHGFIVEITDQPPEKSLSDTAAWHKIAECGLEATQNGITTAADPHWWSVYDIELQ
jgi:hypothetical protein